jgi:hypothetical protein
MTSKIDSLMSMLPNSSFSPTSSAESVFYVAVSTCKKKRVKNSKSSSVSEIIGASLVSPLHPLVTLNASLDVSLHYSDVMFGEELEFRHQTQFDIQIYYFSTTPPHWLLSRAKRSEKLDQHQHIKQQTH